MLSTGMFELGFDGNFWYLWTGETSAERTLVAEFTYYESVNVERIHKAVRAYIGPLAGIKLLTEAETRERL